VGSSVTQQVIDDCWGKIIWAPVLICFLPESFRAATSPLTVQIASCGVLSILNLALSASHWRGYGFQFGRISADPSRKDGAWRSRPIRRSNLGQYLASNVLNIGRSCSLTFGAIRDSTGVWYFPDSGMRTSPDIRSAWRSALTPKRLGLTPWKFRG